MTKKHYIAIANVLATRYENGSEAERAIVRAIAQDLSATFANDNPLFDSFRFFKAVGILEA